MSKGIKGVTVDVSNALKPDLVELNLRFGISHARKKKMISLLRLELCDIV
jgi:hypothetical protein